MPEDLTQFTRQVRDFLDANAPRRQRAQGAEAGGVPR